MRVVTHLRVTCTGVTRLLYFLYFSKVYLPWERIIPKGTVQGATVIGLLVFFSYAIVANTVVPISLYVSVEVGYSTLNIANRM